MKISDFKRVVFVLICLVAFSGNLFGQSQVIDLWDGVHPTAFGHELMAREWIKQVSSRLRF